MLHGLNQVFRCDIVRENRLSRSFQQDKADGAAAELFIAGGELKGSFGADIAGKGERELQRFQRIEHFAFGGGAQPAEFAAQEERTTQPQTDNLAMQQFAVRHAGLDSMAKGVTEVQKGAYSGRLAFILFYNASLNGNISRDNIGQLLNGVEGKAQVDFLCQVAQRAQHARFANDGVFNHFSHALAQHAGRQREQSGRVGHDHKRLVEGAYEVFAGGDVNSCFAAYGAIHLSHYRGGNLNEWNAPVINGGNETCHVAHYTTTQSNHKAAAVVPGGHHFIGNLFYRTQVFALLAGFKNMQRGGVACIFQTLNDFFTVERVNVTVADDGCFAIQAESAGKVPHAVQRVVFHMHAVGACPEAQVDCRHGRIIRARQPGRKAILCMFACGLLKKRNYYLTSLLLFARMRRMDAVWVKILIKVGIGLAILACCWLWGWFRATGLLKSLTRFIDADNTSGLRLQLQRKRKAIKDMEVLPMLVTYAVAMDKADCLRVLLEGVKGEELQREAAATEEYPLSMAVALASPQVLRVLLEAGMKPGEEVHSPWLLCCAEAKVEHARVLAEFGGDVLSDAQKVEEQGKSGLHALVYGWHDHPEEAALMLDYLLERGDDVNALTSAGNTPLDLAADTTHVGYAENAVLRERLLAAGGKRGASLRVPRPQYKARVFVKGALPDVCAVCPELPEGVTVSRHEGICTDEYVDTFLKNSADKERVESLRSHTAYLEITVQGTEGEYPITVAKRAYTVARQLAQQPGVVGVQFGRQIARSFWGEDDPAPMDIVPIFVQHSPRHKMMVLYTDGMNDYGLQEYSLLVPDKAACEKKDVNSHAAILTLMGMAMEGTTGIEPGHTMTLENVFCRVMWGENPDTGKDGFIVLMSADDTPAQYLQPHYKTPD